MPDDSGKLSGAEEFVAAEIELTKPLNPEQERNLRIALEKMGSQALDSCDVTPKKVSFCYDPARTSKEDLLATIREVGGELEKVESEESPLIASGKIES